MGNLSETGTRSCRYSIAFCGVRGCFGGWLAIAPTAVAGYSGTGDYPECYGGVFPGPGAGAINGQLRDGFIWITTGNHPGVLPGMPAASVVGFVVTFHKVKAQGPEK